MRLALVCIILLLPVSHAFAQNSLSVSTNTGINFNFTTAASLETDYKLTNAFTFSVKPKNSNISLYVKLYSFSAPTGYTTGDTELQLDYNTVNSTTGVTNLVTSEFAIGTSDTKMFSIAKSSSTYNFQYHMICTAPGYTTTVGHYAFTLQFTMTSP